MSRDSEPRDFAAQLRQHIRASLYSYGQLARLSSVPKRTIVNWLDGTTKQPRHWQSVVRVAAALRLTSGQIDALLVAAGLPTLAELSVVVSSPADRALLDLWQDEKSVPVANDTASLWRYLDAIAHGVVALPVFFPRHANVTFHKIYQEPHLRRVESTPPTDATPLAHPHEGEPWSSLRDKQRRMVILGQPGMGKSWLLKAEAIRVATEALASDDGEPAVLPILVAMPELVALLQGQAGLDAICQALAELAARTTPTMEETAVRDAVRNFFEANSERVVLLIDALDEVPERDGLRITARRVIIQLGTATRARIVLASRLLGYAAAPMGRYLGMDVPEYEIMPFANREIDRVLRVWFHDQLDHLQRLQLAMRRGTALARQATNPLLLSLMCMLTATRGEELVGNRAGLYEPVLRLLLEGRWRRFEMQLPESRVRAKLRLLEAIAWYFATYRQSWWEQLPGDVLEAKLEQLPETQRLWSTWRTEWGAHYEGPLWELSEWDGILIKGSVAWDSVSSAVPYAFLHRTFQEFLVARYLLRSYIDDGLRAPELQTMLAAEGSDPAWHIVRLLLVELLTRQPMPDAQPLLMRLSEMVHNTVQEPSGQMAVAAVEILLALHSSEVGSEVVRDLRARLCTTMRDTEVPAVTRVHAARLVAELGDPRPEVMDVDAMEFVQVPAGDFWMGSDVRVDTEAMFEEYPLRRRTTGAFAISCYPVSNAQFRVFLNEKEDGFDNPAYWTEAIAMGHWRDGMVWRLRPRYLADGTVEMEPVWAREPYLSGWPTDLPNCPIFGISWYEARAFVRWLEQRWRTRGLISATTRLALPSEAEWEKAARGTDARIYPWGNTFDGNRLNWYGHMLMSPAAIGAFPHSTSPYGAEEMVGNLWEWTRSVFTPYAAGAEGSVDFEGKHNPDVKLAIRGGAYFSVRARCRCAARSATLPYGRIHATFRIVKYDDNLG